MLSDLATFFNPASPNGVEHLGVTSSGAIVVTAATLALAGVCSPFTAMLGAALAMFTILVIAGTLYDLARARQAREADVAKHTVADQLCITAPDKEEFREKIQSDPNLPQELKEKALRELRNSVAHSEATVTIREKDRTRRKIHYMLLRPTNSNKNYRLQVEISYRFRSNL